MKKKYHKVLSIAGSDSGGGAGIQADMKTFSALGCYGMSVITAATAQNTRGVTSVHAMPAAFVEDQLEAVLSDMGADAVKIGMLYSSEVVEIVARLLKKYSAKNIVLDPVMAAQSGDRLMRGDALAAIKTNLIPLATVFTPNLPEASAFLDFPIRNPDDMQKAAIQFASWGARSILIKGGHLDDRDSSDLFYICPKDRFIELKAERIVTRNDHGTGCTLSSAIASYLAKAAPLEEAVINAKGYLTKAIRAGAEYKLGSGRGPVHHFYEFW